MYEESDGTYIQVTWLENGDLELNIFDDDEDEGYTIVLPESSAYGLYKHLQKKFRTITKSVKVLEKPQEDE
jgi:hypothetical protein